MGSGKPKYAVPGADRPEGKVSACLASFSQSPRPECKPSPDVGSSVIKAASQGHSVGAGDVPALPAVFGVFYTVEFCVVKTGRFCFQGEPLPQGNGNSVVVNMSLDPCDGSLPSC